METKFLDLNKPWSCKHDSKSEKNDMYDFPAHDCTRKQNDSPYFSSIVKFDNANGRLYQERMLRSRNFAAMTTWRHPPPFCYTQPHTKTVNDTCRYVGRGGSRGRVQGVRNPPEMTCGFLIQLVFCKKKNYVVYWCWSRARDECTPS